MNDEQVREMLRRLAPETKRKLANKWIRRIAAEWLKPLLDRVEAPTCRRILQNGLDQDAVDGRWLNFLEGHLIRVAQHGELTLHEDELDGRGAALRASKHLAEAAARALDVDIHLAMITRMLSLAIRQCVPMVRVGGRLVYQRYNDDVYKWVVHRNCVAEEAHEQLLECRDIMEHMPVRTEDIGFSPVPLDSVLKRT